MWKVYHTVHGILHVIIAVIGVSVNLLAIVILVRGKCGLSTCTTHYLIAMAAADLSVIISEVILRQINFQYFPVSFLHITPVCSLIVALTRVATDNSVWFTVTFTVDRYVAICCQEFKAKYCTGKTAAGVLATTGILLCLKNIPFYFTRKPGRIVDNVPWGCLTKPTYYTDLGWVGFDSFDKVLTPFLPFGLILLFNALTIRHILVTSRVRKVLRAQKTWGKGSDPEMESRRRSMVLLFTLSGSFILLWMMFVIFFVFYQVTGSEWNDSEFLMLQVGYLLRNVSCCTNTFIYAVTQSKFRDQVNSIVKYPVTTLLKFIHTIRALNANH